MSRVIRPKYERDGVTIYNDKGKEALLEYLKNDKEVSEIVLHKISLTKSAEETLDFEIYCPSCGTLFSHKQIISGKITGGISGILSGAYIGAQFGIAGGPLGAIAGTIPGAILGAVLGKNIGNKFDNPSCPKCNINFSLPKNAKSIKSTKILLVQKEIEEIANHIISISKSHSYRKLTTLGKDASSIEKYEEFKEKMRTAKEQKK